MALYDPDGQLAEEVVAGVQGFVSLSDVSAVGPGAVLNGVAARSNHCAAVTVSEGTTAGEVALDGSLDDLNWFLLGEPLTLASADAGTTIPITAVAAVQFVRASVITEIVGGTVTVAVVSA
jgi:hypothetical protein